MPPRIKGRFCAQNRADYSGRASNCNATAKHAAKDAARIEIALRKACGHPPASLREAPQSGVKMAKSPPQTKKRAAKKARLPKITSPRPAPRHQPGLGADGSADLLARIADALERLAPAPKPALDFAVAEAFVWHPERHELTPVRRVNRVEMELLKGIERVRDLLVENTERFARGLPANNALLWGARGMGKSSLVKAAHASIGAAYPQAGLKLIEIHREDIESLPELMALMRNARERFIVFCDDLSFDADDTSYKSLKTMLEGGIEGRPENVIFYATSNRRHLLARDMMENERGTAINPGEAVEEKVSLSDRFGLWLGFNRCSQDEYLALGECYIERHRIAIGADELRREALEWATTRGARSGRVAWQYVQDLAGRLGVKIGG